VLNGLFGLRIKYYNGANVYRRDLLQDLPMTSNGHGLLAEISLQLIKGGHSYVEVGMHNRERPGSGSNALRLKNAFQVGKVLLRLFWRIQLAGVRRKPGDPKKAAISAGRPSA
jgi:hypothetical protein